MNISEVSSSDDESQIAKPHREDLKKLIKDSDDESSQEQITPKSSQKPTKVKRLKTPHLKNFSIGRVSWRDVYASITALQNGRSAFGTRSPNPRCQKKTSS